MSRAKQRSNRSSGSGGGSGGVDWLGAILAGGGLEGCGIALALGLFVLAAVGIYHGLLWLGRAVYKLCGRLRARYAAAPPARRRLLLCAIGCTLGALTFLLGFAGLPPLPLHIAGAALTLAAVLFAVAKKPSALYV